MKKALYAGSFDPVTFGHVDIIKRASKLFNEVTVGIARSFSKKGLFSLEERKELLQKVIQEENLKNVTVEFFECLTVDFAREREINILIRGLRAISDFEEEFQMVSTNRDLEPEMETIFLMSSQENFYFSSRLVKEIVQLGGKVNKFVPVFVRDALENKLTKK